MKINQNILEYFLNKGKLSCFRLLMYIKSKYNNHLHKSDFQQIYQDLQISKATLLNNLNQLKKLGILIIKGDYIRIFSWKKWCHYGKNKITNITLEQLRDLKYLRTLHYCLKYKVSWKVAKKNHITSELTKKQKSSGFYDVSASFVQKVTNIRTSKQTLLKQLNRGITSNIVEVIKKVEVLFKGSLVDCLNFKKYLEIDCKLCLKSNNFSVYRHSPNKIRF